MSFVWISHKLLKQAQWLSDLRNDYVEVVKVGAVEGGKSTFFAPPYNRNKTKVVGLY